VQPLQFAHGAHHLGDAAGMEQLGIEVVAVAVVTQVQADDVVPRVEQALPERQQVQRAGAALPAVQQHRELGRWRTAGVGLAREQREQPHAIATVDEKFTRDLAQDRRAPLDAGAAQRQARVDRLDVRVAQPPGWHEVRRRPGLRPVGWAHALGRIRNSTRLFWAATVFQTPAVVFSSCSGYATG
jgi:hypothetical protein